jgi:[acyl-carrier-protein] S-malonyltransferase
MRTIESRDIFSNRYSVRLTPYSGIDFSKKCYIFSGQGAAAPGMGRALLERFEAVSRRLQKADALAEAKGLIPPSFYMVSLEKIPNSELSLTRNLCLFSLNVALFELLVSQGECPALLTGHSFGEFAALVASGMIAFDDMFELLVAREKACEAPGVMGQMIAVSADKETLQSKLGSLREDFYFANFNSPNQTVLSVPADRVKSVSLALKKQKLAAKVLTSLPQPYHSPLMEPAAQKFAQGSLVRSVEIHRPRIPMLSSVNGEIISDANFSSQAVREILSRQMVNQVNFIRQVETACRAGYRHFVELSTQMTYSPWVKDILSQEKYKITVPNVLKAEAAPATLKKQFRATHDSKMVGLLNKVISSVTGYSIAEISLSKNFQEDLGIDSIKKAQIVLNFLESQGKMGTGLQDGVMMNQLRTVEDVLTWFNQSRTQRGSGRAPSFSLYKKVWQQKYRVDGIFNNESSITWLSLADVMENGISASHLKHSALAFVDGGAEFQLTSWLDAFRKAYSLLRDLPSRFTFVLVTNDTSSSEVFGLEGFLRSLAKEIGCQFQRLHFDRWNENADKANVIRELGSSVIRNVRFENGKRYELDYEIEPDVEVAATPRRVAAIGGASGASFEIIKSLCQRGARQVVLMGRRTKEQMADSLNELERMNVEVEYVEGDATKESDLQRFLDVAMRSGPVDLLIHGGGFEHSALVEDQEGQIVEEQVAIKLATIRLLRANWRSEMRRLVCFSSTAGEFGNPGQSIYSYANVAMERECELARKNGLNFSVITWPAWDDVGMTAKPEIAQQLKLTGLHRLGRKRAGEIFAEFLRHSSPLICMDSGFKDAFERERVRHTSLQVLFPEISALHFPIKLENWTSKDLPALRDHFIMDQSLVPVSFPLAIFWHLAVILKGRPLRLKNVEALSFMVLHRRDSPYLLDVDQEKELSFEIRSNQTHVRGSAVDVTDADLRIPPYVESAQFHGVDMFKQSYSRFGKRLHLLKNVRVTVDDRAYANVDLSQHSLFPASDSVNRQLVLFEALFHLSGAASEAKTGRVSVPLSFASVVVTEDIMKGQKFRLVVQCRYPMQDILEADLYVYNEDGTPCIAITNERLRLFEGLPQ